MFISPRKIAIQSIYIKVTQCPWSFRPHIWKKGIFRHMGKSGCPTEQGNWGEGVSLQASKFKLSPSVGWKHHILGNSTYLEKRYLWRYHACSMHSVTQSWLISKSSIKTKSLNTKQCPAGLSPRIISQVSPFLPKVSKNCYTHQVWTVPPSHEPLMGNPKDGGKSNPTAKNLLISPIRKIALNRFKSFAVKSFISSPSNNNFQVIILCNLHL